jgi:glycosyltransferase involved in cell wall biosynthesis
MAEAVRVLWREPGLREAMGREGRKRIEAEFTIEREVREWRDLYIRLAQKGRVEGC